jgi:hypothetical protein
MAVTQKKVTLFVKSSSLDVGPYSVYHTNTSSINYVTSASVAELNTGVVVAVPNSAVDFYFVSDGACNLTSFWGYCSLDRGEWIYADCYVDCGYVDGDCDQWNPAYGVQGWLTGSLPPSVTPSVTATLSVSVTASPSLTPSISISQTPTVTKTPSVTPPASVSVTATATPTQTPSPSVSVSPLAGVTLTPTPTTSTSITPTPSATPPNSPSAGISVTPSVTPSVTATPTISVTQTPSSSPASTKTIWDIINPDNTAQPYSYYNSGVQNFRNVAAGATIQICVDNGTTPVDESGLNILSISITGTAC